jgi:hypothetical protein
LGHSSSEATLKHYIRASQSFGKKLRIESPSVSSEMLRHRLPPSVTRPRPAAAPTCQRVRDPSGIPEIRGTIHFDDVNLMKNFATLRAVWQFCQANDVFTVELARRRPFGGWLVWRGSACALGAASETGSLRRPLGTPRRASSDRNHGQEHMRRMIGVMEDRLQSRLARLLEAQRPARVGIDIETRIVR